MNEVLLKIQLKSIISQIINLTDDAWNNLQKLFSYQSLKKKDYFVQEGHKTNKLAFVGKGVLRAFYRTKDGAEYNKTFFVDNSFAISYAAVLQKSNSYLNFQALTDCELLVCNYYEFANLFDKYPDVERLTRIVTELEWVIKKEQREIRLVLTDAEERYKYFQQEYPGLENLIPQYHIASHLGITPIQLSRIRAKLASTSSSQHIS